MDRAYIYQSPQVAFYPSLKNQKQVFLHIGKMMESVFGNSSIETFMALTFRERMGSTHTEYGVSFPHGQLKSISSPYLFGILLEEPVSLELTQPTFSDIFIATIYPDNWEEKKMFESVRTLSQAFIQEKVLDWLRESKDESTFYARLGGFFLHEKQNEGTSP